MGSSSAFVAHYKYYYSFAKLKNHRFTFVSQINSKKCYLYEKSKTKSCSFCLTGDCRVLNGEGKRNYRYKNYKINILYLHSYSDLNSF